jgi:hypothetical protein
MKIILGTMVIFFSATLSAQQFTRPIPNSVLKPLIGEWAGNVTKTDDAYNNALIPLEGKVEVKEDADSLLLNFTYTDVNGKETTEKSSLYLLENELKIRIGGDLFEITSAIRRGPNITIIAEKQAYENYKLMDFRQQIIFSPKNFKLVKEARFIDMDAYFIRLRGTFDKK